MISFDVLVQDVSWFMINHFMDLIKIIPSQDSKVDSVLKEAWDVPLTVLI